LEKISKLFKRLSKSGKKGLAWLVDPEKELIPEHYAWIQDSGLDLILVGGSGGDRESLEETISVLRGFSNKIPICIFPGSKHQISNEADGILFLSLISGTNPDFLISQQVSASLELNKMSLEVLPTGYILVNDGEIRKVHQVSKTLPLLNEDLEQIKSVALAGKFLGLHYFYLEAGSGAMNPVSPEVIRIVKTLIGRPLIVGGGLNSAERVKAAYESGADLIVLGNSVEDNPGFLEEVLKIKSLFNRVLNIN
jgi:phosphoglycerol geranylgeranyltransferase